MEIYLPRYFSGEWHESSRSEENYILLGEDIIILRTGLLEEIIED